jgi:dimethylglycine dehydrogenase
MAPEYEIRVYEALKAAGADLGLKDFGMRALLCLRLEKNFGTWYREFRPIYGPYEAGLGRFVATGKGDFIGREAALAERESGGTLRRICLKIEAGDADVIGDEPIWHSGQVVGWITSGGYGHHVGASLAQGYVPKALADDTATGAFKIEILGVLHAATVLTEPLFDPDGARMRA